ncbi:MAG: VWA domain-containing protein [Promethearchaeota archaeon]
MGIFPENPCEFAVEFIKRMRTHPDTIQIPSSRQVLSIPRLILSRYYRKGMITPNDFIEISTVTSYPDNQKLAKDIAFDILFPSYKKDLANEFFQDIQELNEKIEEDLESNIKSEMDNLQDLIDEIESKTYETSTIQKLEDFFNELAQKRDEEPFKSALQFFNDDSELYKEQISSLEDLLEEARNKMMNKINSLDPEDLKAGHNLGLDDLIQEQTRRIWEQTTSKALNNQDISEDLNKLFDQGRLEDLIQTLKFLGETDALSKENLEQLKTNLKNQIKNLDQLFNAAKNLGETPKFDQEKVLENSMEQASFEHNFNLANSLDQYYGTNLRSAMLDKYAQQSKNAQSTQSLEALTKSAIASKSWNTLFQESLQNSVKEAMKQLKKAEAMKNLTHQMQQLMNTCQNIHSSQKMAQELPELVKKTLEACENSNQLRDSVEFFRKVGLDPKPEDIRNVGEKLGMPEDEIFELIEPNYQLLKKLTEGNQADFQRISNLMNQIKDQLNHNRIKELMSIALASNNREALAALGHFDLGDAIKSSQEVGGEEAEDQLISSLTAGSGENLLKQWFIHRKNIPNTSKQKVKELAKAILVELGIYYSRARLGSAITGPIPINIVRPFNIGDDFDNVDLEETVMNILEKGKKLEHINYDDFLVHETAKGLRSVCIELDVSGSMEGEKLAQLALCTTMLLYGLRKDELAITYFESDTHVLKSINEDIDLEKIADELLSIKARGGTRIQAALEWARTEFKKNANSREKLNILFTDAEVFDLQQAVEELRILRSMNVDFIIVCPETHFNLKEAEKMAKIAGGQLLTLNDWNEFPKLIADIIKSKI